VGLVWAAVILAVLGLFYYLSVARSTFMSDGAGEGKVKPGLALTCAIVLCLAAVVGLGLYPTPLLDASMAASKAFFSLH
jgi:NADH:ubiquinone oxidoreductase subunit 2 (subunit N)